MEVLQGPQDLVCDEAQVDGLQHALSHQRVQVGLHELKRHIQVSVILGPDHPIQFDHVGMVQLPEDADLSIGALRVSGILEGVEDLLERERSFGGAFDDLPDVPVGAAAQELLGLVEVKQVLFDLLAHLSKLGPIDIITRTTHIHPPIARV